MKIKELLNPLLENLAEVVELYGEDEYTYDADNPSISLMYKDSYYIIDDIYFIVEDDGDVVLRINTDGLLKIQQED